MDNRHYSADRLRRSIQFFLVGKAGSALLSFIALVLIVRLLDIANYAYYVACIASVEILLALASFGLDWVTIRYIPEFRVRASTTKLRSFILQVLSLQAIIYLVFATILVLASQAIARQWGMPEMQTGLTLYAVYAFIEGCGRVMRDQILSHLLLQGRAQIALLARNASWVAGLGWLYHSGDGATFYSIAVIETVAAAVGTLIVAIGLIRAMTAKNTTDPSNENNWHGPTFSEMWHLARASYVSYLFSLAYGPQVLTFLLSRYAGVEATAAFGFARSLSEQVRRYLPIELLLSLVRPVLVARYIAANDFTAFNRNTTLLLTISLLAVSPVVVISVVFGDVIVNLLSRKPFADAAVFLVLMVITLAPFSHRRIVEMVANTVGRAGACVRANAALMVFPALTFLALRAGQPAWTALALSLVAEIAFSILVVKDLRYSGIAYRLPWAPLFKIGAAIVTASALLWMWPHKGASLNYTIVAVTISAMVTGICLLVVRPIDKDDLISIQRFLRNKRNA